MNVHSSSPARSKKLKAYQRGKWAEYFAAAWLICKGYRIAALRHITPQGEIDLIARRGNHIVFIEVKARTSFEQAKQSVTAKQRQRISNAASFYIKQRPHLRKLKSRYDIIAITPKKFPQHVVGAW